MLIRFALFSVLLLEVRCGKGSSGLQVSSGQPSLSTGANVNDPGTTNIQGTTNPIGNTPQPPTNIPPLPIPGTTNSTGTTNTPGTMPPPPVIVSACSAQAVGEAPSIQLNSNGAQVQPWSTEFNVQLRADASSASIIQTLNASTEYAIQSTAFLPGGFIAVRGKLSSPGVHTLSYTVSDVPLNHLYSCSIPVTVVTTVLPSPPPPPPTPAVATINVYVRRSAVYLGGDYLLSTDPNEAVGYPNYFYEIGRMKIYALNTSDGIYNYTNIYRCTDQAARHFISPDANCETLGAGLPMGALRQQSAAGASMALNRYYNYYNGVQCITTGDVSQCQPMGNGGFSFVRLLGYGEAL